MCFHINLELFSRSEETKTGLRQEMKRMNPDVFKLLRELFKQSGVPTSTNFSLQKRIHQLFKALEHIDETKLQFTILLSFLSDSKAFHLIRTLKFLSIGIASSEFDILQGETQE